MSSRLSSNILSSKLTSQNAQEADQNVMIINPAPSDVYGDTRNDHRLNGQKALLLRRVEAMIFASAEPVSEQILQDHVIKEHAMQNQLATDLSLDDILKSLVNDYQGRGIQLVKTAEGWQFRTAPDLASILNVVTKEPKKLSRVALETLAIIAYHQPVTRAEIEDIRGVSTMRGTLDTLLETGWVRLRGRRKTIGRPVTYGTTPSFLTHFGLETVSDLPGLDELKGAGFIEGRVPAHVRVPNPVDHQELTHDEEPLESDDAPLLTGLDAGELMSSHKVDQAS